MTLLATIDGHVLHLFCTCGHQKGLEVSELLQRKGMRGASIHDVRRKARCAGCGKLGEAELRIVFAPKAKPGPNAT